MKRDPLGWLAMGASIAVTAQGEWALAVSSGYHPVVAGALPVAIDAYAIRALRSGREVLPAVLAMVATNSAAHLLRGGMLVMSPWLVVAVSAIAPLVLWRMHALKHDQATVESTGATPLEDAGIHAERPAGDAVGAMHPAASESALPHPEVTVERVTEAPTPGPELCPVPWLQLGGASVHPALHPSASVAGQADDQPFPRTQENVPDAGADAPPDAADAPTDAPPLGDVEPELLTAAQAVDRAARDETGRAASLRRLQAELRIGQPRAQQLQRILADA